MALPGYIRSRGVTVSKNFLQSHPGARLYTFSEILREDPGAAIELKAENGELSAAEPADPLPKCHDFANLVFWSPRGQLRAMLSICRNEAHGPFLPPEYAMLSALYWAVHSALERAAANRRQQARLACCERFIASLPLAALFMGPGGEVLFANHAAYDLCAMWNFGPQKAVSFNTRACFALPEAISQAIARLTQADGREASESARVAHPEISGLTATVRRGSGGDAVLAPGCYVVTLAYLDTFLGSDSSASPAACAALQLLSPAERRVALLARDGLTNKEIAARLGRSVTSVVWTLHVTYQKLGVKNRAQLTRVTTGQV